MSNKVSNHFDIAAPSSKVESRLTVLHCSAGRPACGKKLFKGAGIVAYGHANDAASGESF